MEINVGSALVYKGRNYICIAVEQINIEEIAKEDSASQRNYYTTTENVRVLAMEIDIFHVGDITHKVAERITLECPGVDIVFIYTKVKITKKENTSDGEHGVENGVGKGSDNQAEGPRAGDSGREGAGTPSASEVGS